MDFTTIERAPRAFQRALTPAEARAVCARAFGRTTRIESVRELAGGGFNSIYLVRANGTEPAILRVAPEPERFVPWHERDLLRKEHSIQPFLAPIAPLLTRTIFADFTHQVVGRDYLIQSVMPGERWEDARTTLAPRDDERLWRELARLARTLHAIPGAAYGHPHPGRSFTTWSETILVWLEWTIADAEREYLNSADLRALLDLARTKAPWLDEITQPRLYHGDLWPFNVLITRDGGSARISAILDYDRTAWGDPRACWLFHLLPRKASPRVNAVFWKAYGAVDDGPEARFRSRVYDGLHAGNVLSALRRDERDDLLPLAYDTVRQAAADAAALARGGD